MKESQFGFEYTWADLQPVRALAVVVVAAQVVGGVVGLLLPRFPSWFESLFFGAAVVCFPAFLVGLVVQARWRPGSLAEHKVMVRRFGFVAAVFSAFALAMPLLGFGQPGAAP